MAQVDSVLIRAKPSTPPSRTLLPAAAFTPSQNQDLLLPPNSLKSGHLNLDTFSPVNQNGSFEFDRVLKSGKVHRRIKKKGAWKPTWKPAFLVLRPNLLSIYQNEDETDLRASITMSDVTAVALVKKTNTDNVFGVFSPSKNHHFQGVSAADTTDWIDRIRLEARVDGQDEFVFANPEQNQVHSENHVYETTDLSAEEDLDVPDSPEVPHWSLRGQKGTRSRASTTQRRPSNIIEYSGNEMLTSHSDFSDTPAGSLPRNLGSPNHHVPTLAPITTGQDLRPSAPRTSSQLNTSENTDPERVIRQGWLQCLKSTGGVKQWKTLWVVLRPKNLAFYKNEQEYSATKLVPMRSVINAAEIDPMSKSKKFCLQIIMEDTTYRFCAPDEDSLAKWLGALKSVLAKRQEGIKHIAEGATAMTIR